MCKDTKENEYIVIMDIPGAFLYIDMNHNVHMLLEDSTAKLVVILDTIRYRKYI